MNKALVVDDEKLIVKGIKFSLEQDDYEVDVAYDGKEALKMAKEKEYDIVLLDVMLPEMDGMEVCQAIREFSEMPIIMLTAKGTDMDKILGLEYGADDYIEISDLKLDLDSRRVFEKDKEINLTAKEFDILELLTQNPDKVYSREQLLSIVWGNKLHEAGDVRTVDVHVRRLREKIEPNPSEPKYIHTKWGVGYYFKE